METIRSSMASVTSCTFFDPKRSTTLGIPLLKHLMKLIPSCEKMKISTAANVLGSTCDSKKGTWFAYGRHSWFIVLKELFYIANRVLIM